METIFFNTENNNIQYINLESKIPYDWDDYGVFADILYNIKENKVIVDYYGHGSECLSNKDNSINFKDVEKLTNILNIDLLKIANAVLDNLEISKLGINYLDLFDRNDIFLPCKVIRGKNKTNDGILLKCFETKDYQISKFNKQKAVVYFADKNEIIEVAPNYIDLTQNEKYNVIWRNNMINYTIENLLEIVHLIAYKISYAAIDTQNYRNGIFKLLYNNRIKHTIDITNISYPKENERKNKRNEFKNKKMNDLKNWADNKFPDKTENEKLEICENVFKKYYSNI